MLWPTVVGSLQLKAVASSETACATDARSTPAAAERPDTPVALAAVADCKLTHISRSCSEEITKT